MPEAPEAIVSAQEIVALAPEDLAPVPPPADISPPGEARVESAEQVPAEAVSLATPGAPAADRAAKPPPSPALAAPQLPAAVRAIASWPPPGPKRAPARWIGIAALLVGLGFILGRVTAPTPDQQPMPAKAASLEATQPMPAKAASLEATEKFIPKPHPAPSDTTVPVTTAAAIPSSVPNEPVAAVAAPPAPTNAPIASPAAPAHASAPDAPPHAVTAVRAASTARTERIEPSEVTPPSSPEPANPFVQAVQDDIKEDEASHKKSAERPR
jgi:hypothetical protein